MQLDLKNGLIDSVRLQLSPNCDDRPDESDISLVVIHGISLPPGEFGGAGIDQLFTNTLDPEEHPYYEEVYQLKLSCHLLIRRDGELIQYVPFNKRAWHAGESVHDGREQCNNYAIGIELEGTDEQPYEAVQYERLTEVIKLLFGSYPKLDRNSIVGHCDIAPDRKTDPGPAFDWKKLQASLAG